MSKAEDLSSPREQLLQQGYVVLKGVVPPHRVEELKARVDEILTRESEHPFEPADGPEGEQDRETEEFLRSSYSVSEAELARIMRRTRHTSSNSTKRPVCGCSSGRINWPSWGW